MVMEYSGHCSRRMSGHPRRARNSSKVNIDALVCLTQRLSHRGKLLTTYEGRAQTAPVCCRQWFDAMLPTFAFGHPPVGEAFLECSQHFLVVLGRRKPRHMDIDPPV